MHFAAGRREFWIRKAAMQNRLRMLMGATALLYAGPLLAGFGGFGWAIVPVFAAIFLLWLVILRPHQWPRHAADWGRPEAWSTLITQAAVQTLLVAMLFGIGRGLGGALATLPQVPLLLPVAISVLSIPLARLIWNPWKDRDIDRFLDDAIARVNASPAADGNLGLATARRLIVPLADLDDAVTDTIVAQHLLAMSPHAPDAVIRKALLERQHSGEASRGETIALILHATDGALIETVGGDGPTLALAVLPHEPEMIALFARRLTTALTDDPDLWGQCPSVDQLAELVVTMNNTDAEGPLRDLIAATNRAQPSDGLA